MWFLSVLSFYMFADVMGDGNCTVVADLPEVERSGGDYKAIQVFGENATFDVCSSLCCADQACLAFSFNNLSCSKPGGFCCQLKSTATPPVPNTYGPSVRTGVVLRNAAAPGTWRGPQYQTSTFVKSCVVDSARTYNTMVSGDTWPSVWAGNGSMYVMGDDNHGSKMNFWRVSHTGTKDGNATLDLINNFPITVAESKRICSNFGPPNHPIVMKSAGVIEIRGTIYASVQCTTYSDSEDPSLPGRQRNWNSWVITSTNGGITWNVTASPYDMFTGRLTNPMFIPAGKGFEDAPDAYLYVHFPGTGSMTTLNTSYWDGNDYILLGRIDVSKSDAQILNRSAYEFWTGTTSGWTSNDTAAVPVFQHRHMTGQDHTFYSKSFKRYILPNYGFLTPNTGLPRAWHDPKLESVLGTQVTGQLSLLEAQHPWGPWKLFYLEQPWNLEEGHAAYCPDFPQWWIGNITDGMVSMKMVTSACCDSSNYTMGYAYHMTGVHLTLEQNDAKVV